MSEYLSNAESSIARVIRDIRTELVATYVERLGHPEVAKQIRQHFAILDRPIQNSEEPSNGQ